MRDSNAKRDWRGLASISSPEVASYWEPAESDPLPLLEGSAQSATLPRRDESCSISLRLRSEISPRTIGCQIGCQNWPQVVVWGSFPIRGLVAQGIEQRFPKPLVLGVQLTLANRS